MFFSRFKVRFFAVEALFFAGAFAIAILSVLRIKQIIAEQKEIADILPDSAGNLTPGLVSLGNLNTPSFITIEQFLAAFLFVTIFFLYLIKTKYGGSILKLLFVIAMFAGAEIIFRIWLGDVMAIVLAFAMVLARFAAPRVIVHNIAMIIAITGVAINFGLGIDPLDVVLLLVVISVYDFLAVYVTGHMVKMLKSTISLGTVFAMIIPDKFLNLTRRISDLAKINENAHSGLALNSFIYLGGGDLAFPLILGVSAAMRYGAGPAIFVLSGAILGLLALNIIFAAQKEKRPMPALPVLAGFSILGFLASFIYM